MNSKLQKFCMHPAVQFLARLIPGVVFIYASIHKITDPQAFAQVIYNYQIMPAWSINAIAVFMPWVEMIAGIGIIVSCRFAKGAALLIGGMLALFIVVLTFNLIRGLDVDCGCFDSNGEGGSALEVIFRDILLLIPCIMVMMPGKKA